MWDELLQRGAKVEEPDSTAFGVVANLAAAVAECWRSGGIPPRAYLTELRRAAAPFGIVGVASRAVPDAAEGTEPSNPFARRSRRVGE